VEEHVPAGWWQHFKQQCAPAWFRRIFPVITRKIVVQFNTKTYHMCPHISTPPNGHHHITFMTPDLGPLC